MHTLETETVSLEETCDVLLQVSVGKNGNPGAHCKSTGRSHEPVKSLIFSFKLGGMASVALYSKYTSN
jgi:hypothetical protein